MNSMAEKEKNQVESGWDKEGRYVRLGVVRFQSPHPVIQDARRADAACFRQPGRRSLDAEAEYPHVVSIPWRG